MANVKKARTRIAARPNVTLLCRRVVADMARKLPELSHVRSRQILIVSGEARRGSRATVKPLGSPRSRTKVVVKGRETLYCITLRPKFFRASSPEQRVETLLHELLHISRAFDGTLDPSRRHAELPKGRFQAILAPLLRRYLAQADAQLLAGLAHDGEVLARQWLERPAGRTGRKTYTEEQLFIGPVRMITQRPLAP